MKSHEIEKKIDLVARTAIGSTRRFSGASWLARSVRPVLKMQNEMGKSKLKQHGQLQSLRTVDRQPPPNCV